MIKMLSCGLITLGNEIQLEYTEPGLQEVVD